MKQALGICLAGALAAILEISPLLGASPSPTPSPSPGKAAPVTIMPVQDDHVSATGEVEAPSNHSFLSPLGDFARDSILWPKSPFEMVPGKDPNGWSFSLEPYAWAMGLDGEVDVGRLPPISVNVDTKKLLQHLDWGIFGRGEIRKGRWGILGDGFYAELSGSGDLGSVLYKSASFNVQQGLASLALAYRIIDDRRGFLDFYAGARYNYLGVSVDASIDQSGIQQVGDNVTQRIANQIGARVQSAVDAEVQNLRAQFAEETAILQQDVRAAENVVQEDVHAAESAVQEDVRAEEKILGADVSDRIAASLQSDLRSRLRGDLTGNQPLRDTIRNEEILRITSGVRSELRALLNAAVDARLVEDRARGELALAQERARLETRSEQDRARVEARLAQERARIDARLAQARADAQARVSQAEKKLSKAIAQRIENALPTSGSANVWWFDPILGLRGQINFTRWLFLAAQGDVGGFGAGSQIVWNVQATLGVNFTRNIFAELGYRYMYVDYDKNSFLYQMNSFGLFSGIGVKF